MAQEAREKLTWMVHQGRRVVTEEQWKMM